MEACEIIHNMITEGRVGREDFFHHQGNFLDRFRTNPRVEDLQREPLWNASLDTLWYAYTAATVQKLSNEMKFPVPAWTKKRIYRLNSPYFQGNAQDDFKLILLLTTPPEFMSHNLFVLPNVLERM